MITAGGEQLLKILTYFFYFYKLFINIRLILTIEEEDRPDLDYIQQELEVLSQNP